MFVNGTLSFARFNDFYYHRRCHIFLLLTSYFLVFILSATFSLVKHLLFIIHNKMILMSDFFFNSMLVDLCIYQSSNTCIDIIFL